MSNRLDFIRAIREKPDDVATYLIYADWLDEQDNEDDVQTALAIRCTYAKEQYFPKWDQRWITPEDFAAFNQPMLLMERSSVSDACLLGERGFEKYLHWRENRLLERRYTKPINPERGDFDWTTNRWTAIHPFPVGVKGTILWLMENLATLCYYYPINKVTALKCHPHPITTDQNGPSRYYVTNNPHTIRSEMTKGYTAFLPSLLVVFDTYKPEKADRLAARWFHNLTAGIGFDQTTEYATVFSPNRVASPLTRDFATRKEAEAYLKKRLLEFGQWAAERKS